MASLVANSVSRKGGIRIRSQNGIPIVEETFGWIVEADHLEEEYLDIANAPGLPKINVTRSAGGLTVAKSKHGVRREKNPLIWDFTVEFSSAIEEDNSGGDGGDGGPGTDPTAWIPVYETKFERIDRMIAKDKSGDPIVNSAGHAFETGIISTRFIPVWEFFQFEAATVTDEEILERNEVVNETTFKGREPKTLLLTVERSTLGFYYGKRRRLTKYSLKYNSEDWTEKRLDVGTQYIDGSGDLQNFEKDGALYLGNLDGSGGAVTDGDPPAVLSFDRYGEKEFKSFFRI